MKIKQDVRRVYIIRNKETLKVKIGFSNDVRKRLMNLQTGAGCYMELVYATKYIYNYAQVEKDVHVIFKDKRYIGEWFNIKADDAVEILKGFENKSSVCKIIKYYEEGNNATQIAKLLNVSRSGIVKYLKTKGYLFKDSDKKEFQSLYKKDKKIKREPLTKEEIENMVKRNNKKYAGL